MEKKIYFIGIGGISMSSLAVFSAVKGNLVSGSDISESENLKTLSNFGITYHIGHKKVNIETFNPDEVVINCAIKEDNDELVWAKENNKKIVSRAKLLGNLSKEFKNIIAISGTHGKTTTTALIGEIFIEANKKPSIHVGGVLKKCDSSFLIGEKRFFITEACEYKNSFLELSPSVGVVLNVEPDHLDFFKDIKEINSSFNQFLSNSKTKIFKINEFEYMLKNEKISNIFSARNLKKLEHGYSFDFYKNEELIGTIKTNFLGEHNVKNSLVACIVANYCKIPIKTIKKAIKNFSGVKRRFEEICKINKSIVVHDYAHHPTEITKVIQQAKQFGKVLTVFQPHTFSRTKKLFSEFTSCFNESDGLILIKTYPAREEEIESATAKALFDTIIKENTQFFPIFNNEEPQNFKENLVVDNEHNLQLDFFSKIEHKNEIDYVVENTRHFNQNNIGQNNQNKKFCTYLENFSLAKEKILGLTNFYDCILILGAGDIVELAYSLKSNK